MYKRFTKNCNGCNKEYLGNKVRVFCSKQCSSENNPGTFKKGQNVSIKTQFRKNQTSWNTGICGKLSHSYGKKYLLGRKLNDAQRLAISLRMKGKKFTLGMKHTTKTKKKMRVAHEGSKSHLWRGGITKVSAKIRGSYHYRQWRSDVFTRDNFTCQDCGQIGGKLNADHIKPFATIIRENDIVSFEQAVTCVELWNINNGRTLCFGCHKNTESYLNRWFTESLVSQPVAQPSA